MAGLQEADEHKQQQKNGYRSENHVPATTEYISYHIGEYFVNRVAQKAYQKEHNNADDN